MNAKLAILSLSLLLSAAPAFAADDEFTSTAACGANREAGPEAAELGFVEDLDQTKVFADGKEIAREGFQTQMRGNTQIVSLFRDSGDVKYDIDTKAKTAQKYAVPIKGAPKKLGAPLPCAITGF